MIGQGHRRGGRRRLAFVLGGLLLATLAVPGAAGAAAKKSVRIDARDRAATRAYLMAQYAYEKVLVANEGASRTAVEAFVSRLDGECPGVLAGAPLDTLEALSGSSPGSSPPSARKMGELSRESRQRNELHRELSTALSHALLEPDLQAALAQTSTVASLRWRDPNLTLLEHAIAAERAWELRSAPPAVCADMKVWVASGYRTLSPATKAFVREREAGQNQLLRALRRADHGRALYDPLARFESRREQALARGITALTHTWLRSFTQVDALYEGLQRTLGIRAETAPKTEEGPPKGSMVIGHGKTAAGSSYTIRLEPKRTGSAFGSHCSVRLSVEETSHGVEPHFIGGNSGEACLSRSHPKAAHVECNFGLLAIEAQTLPRARAVRLLLSNNRQITSRVALVPPSRGGPAGFYYQAVRGPSPIPVSLTELDAHGRELRTVKLPRLAECTANPVHYLPGGLRTILRATAPGGPRFSIVGKHYRFQGRVHFDLSIEVGEETGIESFGGSIIEVGPLNSGTKREPSPFSPQIETGCNPHEYAIVYGLLKAPGDTVLARISGSLRPLRRVAIPASLHAGGVLAYIALPSVPSELLVRTPGGKTIATEKLTDLARETSERCAGEAEGP
jgi:hypothetical protein